MELASVLFNITKHTLGLLESREARKYVDRIIYLEKQYIKEVSKDESKIDTNAIDHILVELQLISQTAITLKK
jgi:hypothetical protein